MDVAKDRGKAAAVATIEDVLARMRRAATGGLFKPTQCGCRKRGAK
jgi:hypothetical protein